MEVNRYPNDTDAPHDLYDETPEPSHDAPDDLYDAGIVPPEPPPKPDPTAPPPPKPDSTAPPSLASIAAAYVPSSILPGRPSMPAPEIACYASLGVLAILYKASADFGGGKEFCANDIMSAVPELRAHFGWSNGIGTYLGRSGLMVVDESIEPGIDLPKVTGHSPYWFSPSFEAASAALRKLASHPELFWSDADIAKRAGASDPADLARAIARLWGHGRWLKTYPRGRVPRKGKGKRRTR